MVGVVRGTVEDDARCHDVSPKFLLPYRLHRRRNRATQRRRPAKNGAAAVEPRHDAVEHEPRTAVELRVCVNTY